MQTQMRGRKLKEFHHHKSIFGQTTQNMVVHLKFSFVLPMTGQVGQTPIKIQILQETNGCIMTNKQAQLRH